MNAPQVYTKIIVFIIFIVGVGVVIALRQTLTTQEAYFQEQLSTFLIKPITLHNKIYQIKDGRVFYNGKGVSLLEGVYAQKVAYYALLNERDPLFSLEGTDPEALRESIENLRASINKYAPLFSKNEERLLKTSFYPLNFLGSLSALEQKRQDLLHTPNTIATKEYNAQLKNTLKKYREDLENIKNVFRGYLETYEDTKFDFLSGYTSIELLVAFFSNLEKDILMQEKKMGERQVCLSGFVSRCADLKNLLDQEIREVTSVSRHLTVPKDILNNRTIVSRYYQKQINKAPVIVFDQSKCFPNQSPVYFDILWKKLRDEKKAFKLVLLNDIYFYDAPNSRGPYLKLLKEQGAELVYQPVENMYLCPDMAEHLTDASAMYGVYMLLLTNPLFIDKNNLFLETEKLASLENTITQGDVLYKPLIEEFVARVSRFLYMYDENDLVGFFTEDELSLMKKLLMLYNGKSYNFDNIINTIVEHNERIDEMVKILKKAGYSQKADSFIISRGYPFVTFFTFSQNFNDFLEDNSFLIYEPAPIDNFDLISFNTSLKKIFTGEDVLQIMERSRNIKKEFLEKN